MKLRNGLKRIGGMFCFASPPKDEDWKMEVSKLQNELINTNCLVLRNELINTKCLVLRFLASNSKRYSAVWTLEFEEETSSENGRSVGRQLVSVLTSALQLAKLYTEKGVCPSPGEYAEIVDDFRRYVHMMNRLIYRQISGNTPRSRHKEQILEQLQDNVDQDSCLLQTEIGLDSQIEIIKERVSKGELRMKLLLDSQTEIKREVDSPGSISEFLLPQIPSGNLKLQGLLGSGGNGLVYAATCKGLSKEDLPVAAKKPHSNTSPQKDWWPPEEIKVPLSLQVTDSSHIVKVLGVSEEDNVKPRPILIFELMDKNLVSISLPVPLFQLTDMMLQLAKGMLHLHKNDVVHRDLKPENVLTRTRTRSNQNYLVKIADYGSCKDIFATGRNTSKMGTKNYKAPELEKEGASYGRSVDVFSFGKTCLQIYNENKVPSHSAMSSLESLFKISSRDEPAERPSFREICEELWIIMEELLTNVSSESIKSPIRQIYGAESEFIKSPILGIYGAGALAGNAEHMITGAAFELIGRTLRLNFELKGDYCVITWLRYYSDGKIYTIKHETCKRPDTCKDSPVRIMRECTITEDDVDIVVKFSFPKCCHLERYRLSPP